MDIRGIGQNRRLIASRTQTLLNRLGVAFNSVTAMATNSSAAVVVNVNKINPDTITMVREGIANILNTGEPPSSPDMSRGHGILSFRPNRQGPALVHSRDFAQVLAFYS